MKIPLLTDAWKNARWWSEAFIKEFKPSPFWWGYLVFLVLALIVLVVLR